MLHSLYIPICHIQTWRVFLRNEFSDCLVQKVTRHGGMLIRGTIGVDVLFITYIHTYIHTYITHSKNCEKSQIAPCTLNLVPATSMVMLGKVTSGNRVGVLFVSITE